MKFYIGLGGIGCRVLQDYSDSLRDKTDKEFFYVDSDQASAAYRKADDYYIVSGISYGSSMMRRIGYNSMIYELFAGKADRYFSKVRVAKNVAQDELLVLPAYTAQFVSIGGDDHLDLPVGRR